MKTRLNNHFAQAVHLVSILCVLCASVVNSSAQDFKTVHDGVEYAEVNYKIGDDPVKINLLRLDLKKVRLDVHHAMDAAIGTEKTSSIATRHGGVAAINAGFFRLDMSIFAGDSVGLLMIDRDTLSDPTNNRIVLGISNRRDVTEVEFGRSEQISVIRVGKRNIDASGINRQRGNNDLVIYTPHFYLNTLTTYEGIEVVVRNDRIVKINLGKGSSVIPSDGFVLSASGSRVDELRKIARVGMRASHLRRVTITRISHEPDPPTIEDEEDAVAGVP